MENVVTSELLVRFLAFLALVLWELRAPRRPLQFGRTTRWPNNIGVVAVDTVLARLLVPTTAVGLALVCEERDWGLFYVLALPPWATIPLAFLALDLAIYLQHVMFHAVPALWRLPAMGVVGALVAVVLMRSGHTLSGFVASSLATTGVIATAGASMFPFIMPSSTHLAASLTVWDSVSSHLTLGIMFWATVLFMPFIVVYTGWAYRVMRGKVTAAYIRENEHGAY